MPLRFQWLFGGLPVPGATNTSLSIQNVQLSDSGNYAVRVENEVGTNQSSIATLAVVFPPATVRVSEY